MTRTGDHTAPASSPDPRPRLLRRVPVWGQMLTDPDVARTRQALWAAWRRLPRWARRAVTLSLTVLLLIGGTAAVASADDGNGGAPAALGWLNFKDSSGVPINHYELSLDRGGVTSPGKFAWALITDWFYGFYRGGVSLAIWAIDWVLSFTWLDLIAAPAYAVADALQRVVDQFGLVPTLLTITAFYGGVWMLRGKWTLGLFEIFMACLVASLATGVFANPVGLVAGHDGLLNKGRDAGLGIAYGVTHGGDTNGDPDQMRIQMREDLVDTFLREPTEIVNFGVVLDGTKCEKVYTKALNDGPYGDDADDLRTKVGACNSDAKDVADNPSSGMAFSTALLYPAAVLLIILALLLAGGVLTSALYALFKACMAAWHLLVALLPGGARGSLWVAISEVLMATLMMVFSIVFLAVYMLLLRAIFSQGGNPMKTFAVTDVILACGLVVYWRGRGKIKAGAESLAQLMSRRPGAGATALPQRQSLDPAQMYYKSRLVAQGARVGASALGAGAAMGGAGLGIAGKAAAGTAELASRPARTAAARVGFASSVARSGLDDEAAAGGSGGGGQSGGGSVPGTSLSVPPSRSLTQRMDSRRSAPATRLATRAVTTAALSAATGGASGAASAAVTAAKASKTTRQLTPGRTRLTLAGPGTAQRHDGPVAAAGPAPRPPAVVAGEVVSGTPSPPASTGPAATTSSSSSAGSADAAGRLRARLPGTSAQAPATGPGRLSPAPARAATPGQRPPIALPTSSRGRSR